MIWRRIGERRKEEEDKQTDRHVGQIWTSTGQGGRNGKTSKAKAKEATKNLKKSKNKSAVIVVAFKVNRITHNGRSI